MNHWSSRSSYLNKQEKSIEASNSQTSKGSLDNLYQSLFETDPGILPLFIEHKRRIVIPPVEKKDQ